MDNNNSKPLTSDGDDDPNTSEHLKEIMETMIAVARTQIRELQEESTAQKTRIENLLCLNNTLAQENRRLGDKLAPFLIEENVENSWTAEDDIILSNCAGWRSIKPYYKVLKRMTHLYEGLLPSLIEAYKLEIESRIVSSGGRIIPFPEEHELQEYIQNKSEREEHSLNKTHVACQTNPGNHFHQLPPTVNQTTQTPLRLTPSQGTQTPIALPCMYHQSTQTNTLLNIFDNSPFIYSDEIPLDTPGDTPIVCSNETPLIILDDSPLITFDDDPLIPFDESSAARPSYPSTPDEILLEFQLPNHRSNNLSSNDSPSVHELENLLIGDSNVTSSAESAVPPHHCYPPFTNTNDLEVISSNDTSSLPINDSQMDQNKSSSKFRQTRFESQDIDHPILKENFVRSKRQHVAESTVTSTSSTKKQATRQNIVTPKDSSHKTNTRDQVPSLLSLKIDKPANLDRETISWLKRSPLHGCWNCGHSKHGHENCPYPEERSFCKTCGDTVPENKVCRNCQITENVMNRKR
ncbi:uncharacterized protein LOC127282429 [Leptopilina boulardi]|uniref:uncharacterized protein LOC127282429 n=1 Tax=Leptopilina boulardi TaxID=63433 RepID=UPI0021F5BF63|nr:uncharacterized protein LOC127282429 [Leptopilina boulardi]